MIKTCEICGKIFRTQKWFERYCSDQCYQEHLREKELENARLNQLKYPCSKYVRYYKIPDSLCFNCPKLRCRFDRPNK